MAFPPIRHSSHSTVPSILFPEATDGHGHVGPLFNTCNTIVTSVNLATGCPGQEFLNVSSPITNGPRMEPDMGRHRICCSLSIRAAGVSKHVASFFMVLLISYPLHWVHSGDNGSDLPGVFVPPGECRVSPSEPSPTHARRLNDHLVHCHVLSFVPANQLSPGEGSPWV